MFNILLAAGGRVSWRGLLFWYRMTYATCAAVMVVKDDARRQANQRRQARERRKTELLQKARNLIDERLRRVSA